jgi:hypothetical protein
MRSAVAFAAAVVLAAWGVGCTKEGGKKKAEPSAAPKEDPAAGNGAKGGGVDMPNKQANCPTTVEGATTKVAWTDTDIQITITGDEKVLKEVAERAKHLEEVSGASGGKIEHSGNGTGGGAGKCPVVMKDTKVHAALAGDRVVIQIAPTVETGFEALKAEVSRRQVAAGGEVPTTAQLTGEAGWDGGVPGSAGADMSKKRIEKLKKEDKRKNR